MARTTFDPDTSNAIMRAWKTTGGASDAQLLTPHTTIQAVRLV